MNSPEVSRHQIRGRLKPPLLQLVWKDLQMCWRWTEGRCGRDSPARFAQRNPSSLLLTVSAVEFGEARRVAAGQLGGAPEGGWRQTGNQRGVARPCRPITKQNGSTWSQTGLYPDLLRRNRQIKTELSASKVYGFPPRITVTVETTPDPSQQQSKVSDFHPLICRDVPDE